jgi:hypothetical protein
MGSNSVRIFESNFPFFLHRFEFNSDESTPKFADYRPVFFDGRAVWIQDVPIEPVQPIPSQSARSTERTTTVHPFTQFDERSQSVWASARVCQRKIPLLVFLCSFNFL